MSSTSLNFLRTVPQQQADIYNNYLKKSTPSRMDAMIPGPDRLQQMTKLADSATNALQSLLTQTDTAETTIRESSENVATASSETIQTLQWAIDHNLSIQDICSQLIAENNRPGFTVLKNMLPWVAKTGKLVHEHTNTGPSYDRAIQTARDLIAGYEKQLFTPAEQALHSEVQEVNISISYVRLNFKEIQYFLEQQYRASAVAGQFVRLKKLWRWQGLPGDNQLKGRLTLGDDFGGMYAAAPLEQAVTPAQNNFDPNGYFQQQQALKKLPV